MYLQYERSWSVKRTSWHTSSPSTALPCLSQPAPACAGEIKAFSLEFPGCRVLRVLFWRITTQNQDMIAAWLVLHSRTTAAVSHFPCRENNLQMGPQTFEGHLHLTAHMTFISSGYLPEWKRECPFCVSLCKSLIKEMLGSPWHVTHCDSQHIFDFGIVSF